MEKVFKDICEEIGKVKEVKQNKEYMEIVQDVSKINYVLKNGTTREIISDFEFIINKESVKLYNDIVKKYKKKSDFNITGFSSYEKAFENIYEMQGNSIEMNDELSDFKLWVIRYLALKILRDYNIEPKIDLNFERLDNVEALEEKLHNNDEIILENLRKINVQ